MKNVRRGSGLVIVLTVIAMGLALALAVLPMSQAQGPATSPLRPEEKVEAALAEALAVQGSADMIVRFAEQADLSPAYAMGWQERGEFVVQVLAAAAQRSQGQAQAYLDGRGLRYHTFIAGNELYIWSGDAAAVDALAGRPEVASLRLAREYPLDPIISAGMTAPAGPQATVDWGITDTHADQFWTTFGVRGEGIVVAGIDTGVQWNHPALVNQFRCPGAPGNPACWADPSNVCGGSACDNNGHGTHTMGTMVADDNPSLAYIAGMAPNAQWIACKGCESSSCSDYALNACADWILAPAGNAANRPHVVNNSWGGGGCDSWYQPKVQAWRAAGIFPAFSAGNSGSDCTTLGSPGDYQESFASAAHDSSRASAYFSSRGPSCYGHDPYTKPNLSAPGVYICSSVPTNGWDCGYSGTSMASPHSAGAVALLWSCNPNLIGQVNTTFQYLQNAADPPPAGNCGAPPDGQGNYTYGYGYLNVYRAGQLYCSTSITPLPTSTPGPTWTPAPTRCVWAAGTTRAPAIPKEPPSARDRQPIPLPPTPTPEPAGARPPAPCLPNALVILGAQDMAGMKKALATLEARGGCALHIFPPRALIGYVPPDQVASLVGPAGLVAVHYAEVDEDSLVGYGPQVRLAAHTWNDNYIRPSPPPTPAPGAPTPQPLIHDVRENDIPAERRTDQPPGYYDLNDFLAGDIAIGIILPESNGAIDPSTENWDSSRINQVVSEIQAGMNWWANVNPSGQLAFYYDIHAQVPTGYEPINRSSDDDTLWIAETLSYLGYSGGDWWDQVYDYLNAIRSAYGTDWAVAVFVVDSLNDPDGRFTDFYFAYAGLVVVMTYDNDGWGIGNMDSVVAHEFAHEFGAGDEYCDPGYACCWCGGEYGYLGIANSNCEAGCDHDHNGHCDGEDSNPGYNCNNCPTCVEVSCLMRSGGVGSGVCSVSRQQVGIRDSDGDGILDPVDTIPSVAIASGPPDMTNDNTLTYAGAAEDIPYDSPTYPDVTINHIASVQYQVDGGAWTAASADDGAFDETPEDYHLTTAALPDGVHTIGIRATNRVGNISSIAHDTVTVDTTPPTNPTSADPHCTSPCHDPNFTWSGASDNLSGVAGYNVYWGTNPGGTSSYWTTSPAYDPAPIGGGIYYLRVRTQDNAGNWQVWETLYTLSGSPPVYLPLVVKHARLTTPTPTPTPTPRPTTPVTGYDILLLSPDSTMGNIYPLLAALDDYPEHHVAVWDNACGPPTLSDLLSYDVVVIGNDYTWESAGLDKTAVGNVLADYIDAGGKVIESLYVQSFDQWGFGGRYLSGGYSPFTMATLDNWSGDAMSILQPGHPVMQGVASIGDSWGHQDPGLRAGAALLAIWSTSGYRAVAVNNNVVALNQLLFHNANWYGDVPKLLHNAIVWLAGQP